MKILIRLIYLCILISQGHAQKLSVDWAVFNYGAPYLEIYYSCPYSALQYIVKNDTVFALYRIHLSLKNIDKLDSISEIFNKRAFIPSFKIAEQHDMKLIDVVNYLAPPGRYLFKFTLEESLSIYSFTDTIKVPDFSQSPILSSIELSTSITKDSTGSKFTKNGFKIIPNPDLIFGQAYELAYVYFECYNLSNDTLPYELTYRILDKNKSVVKSFPSELNKKTTTSAIHTFALSTKGLVPGDYIFDVTLQDLSTGEQGTQKKQFRVVQKKTEEQALPVSVSAIDTSKYAREIKFLATPSEIRQYNKLNDAGKVEFLHRFWQKHNLDEFTDRLTVADEKYRSGGILGRDTDRGRIYIKYGQPDELVVHSMVENVKSHEHWYYYARGMQLLFSDIKGNGNLQLIYSNTDAEPKNPNWEKYIDPLELDDLR